MSEGRSVYHEITIADNCESIWQSIRLIAKQLRL